LKPVLVQCAWGAARTKGTYYQAQFFRLKGRRGPKKAAIAVAASMLTAAYHMLRDGTFHQDLGADFLIKRDRARIAARLAERIKVLCAARRPCESLTTSICFPDRPGS
jgi:transposase